MFAGYASRIEKEIKALYIEKGLKNTKDKSIKVPITIIDSPRRKYSVFIGATVTANAVNQADNEYCIAAVNIDDRDDGRR